MNRDLIAKVVTALVIAGALGVVIARKSGGVPLKPSEPASLEQPRDTIYAMLDSARAGDTRKYLALYTGQMAASLKQAVVEKGNDGFKTYLQTANAEIKGVAVQEPRLISDREAQVRVEYIYQDRNEAQTVLLEKRPEGWKIARVDSAERMKTLVPYGTPVK